KNPADAGLNVTGKNGLMPFPLSSNLSKDCCVNPFIKIILQSKALSVKVLLCNARTNTAILRQTVPNINRGINQSLYLPYRFNAGSKKCIWSNKKIRFAYRQFGIKA